MGVKKSFFRYVRGELLNGFYIRKLNTITVNLASIESLKTELLYWMNVQFSLSLGEFSIRHNDLKGISQIAGILNIRGISTYLNGWFRASESYVVGIKQRSERGLFNQSTGELEYQRTTQDDYSTDISTIAAENLRMSIVPDNAVPVGYIWGEETAAIDETGKIDPDLLHAHPPTGYTYNAGTHVWEWTLGTAPLIYAPWYGDKYMPLAKSQAVTVTLSDNLLELLLEAQQKIKYNGLGLGYLLEITSSVIPDLIDDLNIVLTETGGGGVWYYKMTFTRLADNFTINDGWGRFSVWVYFIQSKYPFIQFNEDGI